MTFPNVFFEVQTDISGMRGGDRYLTIWHQTARWIGTSSASWSHVSVPAQAWVTASLEYSSEVHGPPRTGLFFLMSNRLYPSFAAPYPGFQLYTAHPLTPVMGGALLPRESAEPPVEMFRVICTGSGWSTWPTTTKGLSSAKGKKTREWQRVRVCAGTIECRESVGSIGIFINISP